MSLSPLPGTHPDRWLSPHQPLDPSRRLATYGRVRPMDEDRRRSLLSRLFHWG